MTAQGQPNSPFNFIQVIIGALGTSYLNVIIFFLAGAAGASRRIGPNPTDVVAFDHLLQFTLIPILFFGKAFWERVINFEALAEEGVIAQKDLELFSYCESAEEAWEHVCRHYAGTPGGTDC